MTTHDTLLTSQAAVEPRASLEQLEAFQQMHRQLRMRFFASLPTVPTAPIVMTTQAVPSHPAVRAEDLEWETSPTPEDAGEASVQAPAPEHKVADVVIPTAVQLEKPQPILQQTASIEGLQAHPIFAKQVLSHTSSRVVTQGIRAATPAMMPQGIRMRPTESPAETRSKDQILPYHAFREQNDGTYHQMSVVSQRLFDSAPRVTTLQAAPASAAAPAPEMTTQKASTGSAILVAKADGYSHSAAYSTLDFVNLWKAWSARNQGAASPHATQAQPPSPPPAPPVNLLAKNDVAARENVRGGSDVDPDVTPAAARVVEAFEWKAPVDGYTSEAVTLEGWTELHAPDHWPVIYWDPEAKNQAAMISYNTAVLLSKFADAELQPDAAIVFGKIPAGWDVEYSDRAEKVVYLGPQNETEVRADGERYFAFINAAPGAQLVTLKATLGADTAAVAVPVLGGTSTYLDLTAVSKRVFSGYVLDAGAEERTGVANAAVSVVGQPNAVFFTTESGYFHLSEVFAVGSYPVFVETTTPTGFKHRYRVTPAHLDGVDLYHMGEQQVRAWVSQLEGGVSPDSGLIVAAMPGLVQRYGDGRLFPETRTLLSGATLTPETYTLDGDGSLDEGKPLEASASRYVSVQIPTGPVVTQVEDNNQNVVWSQLVLAQPGVISVVGPN